MHKKNMSSLVQVPTFDKYNQIMQCRDIYPEISAIFLRDSIPRMKAVIPGLKIPILGTFSLKSLKFCR